MLKSKLTTIELIIKKELSNLKKSINKNRSHQNIIEKQQKLHQLVKEYKIIFEEISPTLSPSAWNEENLIYDSVQSAYETCIEILETSLAKMPKVDIKLGTSLVQTYDGSPDNMLAFLDAVELFSNTVEDEFTGSTAELKAAARETVYKFVKTRLTGKARQVIVGVENITQLIAKIKEQCSSKVNSDQIRAKLKALKQKGSINDLCDEVEKLTLQLATKYAEEKIPIDKANQMATKCGIETLINGTTSSDCKLVLKAGSFGAINDAIQKVQEIHSDNNAVIQKANVFYAKNNNNNNTRGNYQQNRGNFRGNRGRNNSQRYSQSNQQNGNYPQYRGNFNRGRGYQRYHQQRGNWSQQGQQTPNYGMFWTNSVPNQQQIPNNPNIMQQLPNTQIPNQQQAQSLYMQQTVPTVQQTANFLGSRYGPRTQ